MSSRRPSSTVLTSAVAALGLAIGLSVDPSAARANRGFFYGPEDAVAFGPPSPNGLVGYCVPWSLLSAAHVGFGGTLLDSSTPNHRLVLDVSEAMRCGRSLNADPGVPGYVFIPQFGFTLDTAPLDGSSPHGRTRLGRLGVGFGVGTSRAAITYAPRFVFGNRDGIHAVGVRHGVIAALASDLVTFELSHQLLVVGGHVENDVRATFSLNVLILAYVLGH